MGVLACNRTGCDNIMCDHYSWEYNSYLCNDCLDDLQKYFDEGNTDVSIFLGTHKYKYSNPFNLKATDVFKRTD